MIKDRETLETIFNIVKQVKKPLVKIYPDGRIIGTDEQFASLNVLVPESITYNIDIPYILRSTEMSSFMRDLLKENGKLIFNPFEITMEVKKYFSSNLVNHIELSYQFDELYSKVIDTKNYNELYKEEQFQNSIPEMFSLKSIDGDKMFIVDKRFIMTSFNAIHPANKSDTVDLIIRDYDYYSYTAEFIIYKKKDHYQLHEFLRFRKL